jgi:hypothetical protein
MASALRVETPRARPGFRVSGIRTETAPIEQHAGRERLMAVLALFFGVVALSLAGARLYGVPDYPVPRRRRETGMRAASREWSTGRIGMAGMPYFSWSQWQAASVKPPRLAAILSYDGATDAWRELAFHAHLGREEDAAG